jgi:antitoxin HigA-1
MKDSNLNKYLSGERKLNTRVALKLIAFSHTKPEQWHKVLDMTFFLPFQKWKGNVISN